MSVYLGLFALLVLTLPIYLSWPRVYLWLNVFVSFLVAGLRGVTVGADTLTYANVFSSISSINLPSTVVGWLLPLNDQRFEAGFIATFKAISNFTSDFRIVIFVSSLLVALSIIYFLNHFKTNYPIALATYLAIFYPFLLNGMRQAIAFSICLIALVKVDEKKLPAFFFLVFIAATFHVSAWLVIITPLTRHVSLTRKNIALFSVFGIGFLVGFEAIYGRAAMYSEELSSFGNSTTGLQGGGLNLIVQILICLTLLMICKITRLYEDSDENKTWIWFILITTAINLVAFKFNQLSRMAMYFTAAEMVIIPKVITKIPKFTIKLLTYLVVFLIITSYFVVIQVYRPDWNGIIPYALLGN